MNSVFKSSKSTSEIQEENLPTVLSSISKASKLTKLTKYQISKHVVSWLLRITCAAVGTVSRVRNETGVWVKRARVVPRGGTAIYGLYRYVPL